MAMEAWQPGTPHPNKEQQARVNEALDESVKIRLETDFEKVQAQCQELVNEATIENPGPLMNFQGSLQRLAQDPDVGPAAQQLLVDVDAKLNELSTTPT